MNQPSKHTNDTKKNLPHGWRWVKLGEVCELNPRRPQLNRADDELTSFVPMETVDAITGTIVEVRTRPFGEVKKGYTFFLDNDVLFAKITPCMQNGKHAIALGLLGGFGFGTTEFHVLRAGPHISADWVWRFLRQPIVLQKATDQFTGSVGQQRLPDDYLKSLQIPLPPLSEQKRIASILKEHMAAVDKARAAAEARLEAVKAMPTAFLRGVFPSSEDPLPIGWRYGKLKEVASLQGGYAFKSAWFKSTGIRLLRNANIYQDYISWSNVVYLSEQRRAEFGDYELSEGDIVLSLDRPVVAAGLKVSRISKLDIPSLLLQRVVSFKLKQGFSSDFLYSFLHTEAFKVAITKHDQSLGVPHVSPSQVENTVIPIPPLAEQNRLATLLRHQMAAVEKARASAEAELQTINALPAALLRKAFNGEV